MDNVFKTKQVQISEIEPDGLYKLINKAVDDAINRAIGKKMKEGVEIAIKTAITPLSDDITLLSENFKLLSENNKLLSQNFKLLSEDIQSLVDLKVYSKKEVADILKISEQTVTKYLKKDGNRPPLMGSSKKGHNYVITHKNLMQFINGNK